MKVMKSENESRLAEGLKKRERELRMRFEREYKEKLRAAVARHEEELHHKKALLEKRMMEHISKAFS